MQLDIVDLLLCFTSVYFKKPIQSSVIRYKSQRIANKHRYPNADYSVKFKLNRKKQTQ